MIAHATRASRCHSTLRGRTLALSTFSIPKLTYLFKYLPISTAQTARAVSQISGLAWGGRKPYLNKNIMALPTTKGGFGFPSLAHLAVTHFHHLAFPACNSPPVPDWAIILRELWTLGISTRYNPKIPAFLADADFPILHRFYFNPFLQAAQGTAGRHVKDSLPKLWESVISNAYNPNQTFHAHYNAEANLAPNMNLPLLSSGLWNPSGLEARLLGRALEVDVTTEPVTLKVIPAVIARLKVIYVDLTAAMAKAAETMIDNLSRIHADALEQLNSLDTALHDRSPIYNLTFTHRD
ncbi:hypothetical protein GGI24_001983 [Coemansia furcata]|nr:hypothetical protein GGI24_001983 [Coemansia furcata]